MYCACASDWQWMIAFCIFVLQMASCISMLELNVVDGKHVYPAQVVVSVCHLHSNLP